VYLLSPLAHFIFISQEGVGTIFKGISNTRFSLLGLKYTRHATR
jgi:hypothetical protein